MDSMNLLYMLIFFPYKLGQNYRSLTYNEAKGKHNLETMPHYLIVRDVSSTLLFSSETYLNVCDRAILIFFCICHLFTTLTSIQKL
jgi:hypothetical protein